MTKSTGQRRHLATSPFKPKPEPVIPEFAVDDRVCHDSYGLGRVIREDPGAVVVDFGARTLRIVTPFHKLERL